MLTTSIAVAYLALRMPRPRYEPLGPGWLPFWAAVILGVLSLSRIVVGFLPGSQETGTTPRPPAAGATAERRHPGLAAAIIVALAAMTALVHFRALRFRPAAFLFFLGVATLLHRREQKLSRRVFRIATGIAAIVMSVAIHWLFTTYLNVRLP